MTNYTVKDSDGKLHELNNVTPTWNAGDVYFHRSTPEGRELIAWFSKPIAVLRETMQKEVNK